MGRQWNTIIESLGPLSGGTGLSINANLTEIEALLTTLQADIVDGIIVSSGSSVITGGTLGQLTGGTVAVSNGTISTGTVSVTGGTITTGSVSITGGTLTSGTVTVNPTYATSGGTGPISFTSTSYGTIAASNANRRGLTVFNDGPGNLLLTIGTATTSTSSYTIKISSGDYYELPYNYTGLIGGIFATTGTARVTELS